MTDQTIPADKVRDLRDQYARLIVDAGTKEAQAYYGHVVKVLDALLPAPKHPTLAGMTAGERVACKWMQADTEQQGRTVIISPNASVGRALMIDQEANLLYVARDEVTPRPDLPRMEWPDTEKAAPAPAPALPEGWRLADHKDLGRGIVTNTTPNRNGHVYFVLPDDEDHRGYGEGWCDPEELTYIDQEADTSDAVPPNTLAEGSKWDDTDALTRACDESGRDQIIALDRAGDAYVWSEAAEWWESVGPLSMNGPFTILHTGKKADQ